MTNWWAWVRAAIVAVVPLIGDWQLDLARTHYGPGVDRRRSERFTCAGDERRLRCVIRSVRANGQQLTARFDAPLDGTPGPVTGMPGMDQVRLRTAGEGIVDATFLSRGQPAFGYRAYQSGDGHSLMIVSVDPLTREALTTVVVYSRRAK